MVEITLYLWCFKKKQKTELTKKKLYSTTENWSCNQAVKNALLQRF